MKQLIWTMALAGLAAATTVATAESEVRCRIDGAYINTYGDNESEQRKNCERQGGVLTNHVPHESQGDRSQHAGGSHANRNQGPGGGSMSQGPGVGEMSQGPGGGSMSRYLEHNLLLHSRALHPDLPKSTHFCILSHPSPFLSTQPTNSRVHIHLQPIHPNLLNHLSDFILLSDFSFSSFMAFFAPDFNHSVTVHDLSSSHPRSYSIIPVFFIFVELVLIIFW